ncbi:MAG: sugar kinase [Paracoccaceae bacterium]|nr:MAG: sugar kinase [Paracoccaceae bacterium]
MRPWRRCGRTWPASRTRSGASAPSTRPISRGPAVRRDVFLSIGECMVEMAPQDGGGYAMGFAGDTFNTAWYARRCLPPGWAVRYLTAVGQDAVSDRMLAFMAREGIDTSAVSRLPDRTVGLYLIELTDGERSFAYWRGQSAARCLARDAARIEAALQGVRLAYLSGITLAILSQPDRARLLAALSRARGAGTVVAFDPNLRPRLWPGAADMRAAITEGAGVADVVLPSHEDEATHFGDADPEATAERYASAGASLVVVKNGPGAIVARQAARLTWHMPAAVPRVVDTTAAGDSFNAAFLGAWLAGAGLQPAMAAGAELAARVIGARGALVP